MELLDKLALPVSGDHLNLLRYLLLLAMWMFVVYSGLLYGSLFTSLFYAGKKQKDSKFSRLAKDVINLSTTAPLIWFALGIAPFIAIILIYTQLMHTISNSVISYLTFSFFFFCAGLASAYFYKQSLYVVKASEELADDDVKTGQLGEYVENTGAVVTSSRLFGLIFLTISLWMFMGATSSAVDPSSWDKTIFYSMFSIQAIFKFATFLSLSLLLTGVSFVFINYSWSKKDVEGDEEYQNFAKKQLNNLSFNSVLFIPVLYAVSVIYIPKDTISVLMFAAGIVALVLFLVSIHFIFVSVKENTSRYASFGFTLALLAVFSMTAQDQIAFSTSTEANVIALDAQYQKLHPPHDATAKAEPAISGEEIYKTRCSACHKFDKKQITAPAYDEVLPKYIGNEQEMLKFVLNPYPIDKTDYPQGMANQGLKPAEAKAIVEYLLGEVKKHTTK